MYLLLIEKYLGPKMASLRIVFGQGCLQLVGICGLTALAGASDGHYNWETLQPCLDLEALVRVTHALWNHVGIACVLRGCCH